MTQTKATPGWRRVENYAKQNRSSQPPGVDITARQRRRIWKKQRRALKRDAKTP